MKGTLTNVFIFAAGAIVGSLVTCKIVKTKYERIAQEEIDSVKETFSRKYHGPEQSEPVYGDTEDVTDISEDDKEISEYKDLVKNIGYADTTNDKEAKKPYVISPDDFGAIDEYELVTLIYYADGVLTDDNNEPVENVEKLVGRASLNRFGEYESDADSVFVRNDALRTDFEILSDSAKYSDIANKGGKGE